MLAFKCNGISNAVPATKSKPEKATAFFHASYGQATIDKENGILVGVKLMELGRLAKFAGEDGKSKSITITTAHISALMGHAGNRALPIHETHEWFNAEGTATGDSTERAARIGSLKKIRTDDNGNLVADAYLNLDRQPARDLLFGAEHNPEDNCFSVVFSYDKNDPLCLPLNFRAADVVPSGAATTALFSETKTSETMTDDEKKKADETAAEAMEKACGVTDADKRPEDDQQPALMRAFSRMSRAQSRVIDEKVAKAKEEMTAEISLKSEAAATALLGKGGRFEVTGGKTENKEADEYDALVTAKLTANPGMLVGRARYMTNLERPELFAKKQEQVEKSAQTQN